MNGVIRGLQTVMPASMYYLVINKSRELHTGGTADGREYDKEPAPECWIIVPVANDMGI